jgi:hypothetical protein
MGDTLVFIGAMPDSQTPPWYRAGVISSFDNGSTFSNWQILDSTLQGGPSPRCHLFGFQSDVFAFVEGRVVRSTDAGITWVTNRERLPHQSINIGYHSANRVFSLDRYYNNDSLIYTASLSEDRGDHWRIGVPVPDDISDGVQPGSIAATQNRILILGYDRTSASTLTVSSGDRNAANWQSFVDLSGPPQVNANPPFLLGDSLSETAMVLQEVATTSWTRADLYLNRTTDGGRTWDGARNLSEGHPLQRLNALPELFYRGKLWGVIWEDWWNPDSTQWGVYSRISANHGKDWYPAQPLGLDMPSMEYSGGQFVDNEVRVYWGSIGYDYGTATGIMTPDTLPPSITLIQVPDSTSEAHQAVQFIAHVVDNDTLSEVTLLLNWGDGGVFSYPMIRGDNDSYSFTFQLPEEARYLYKIQAEDFWENVGSYPDSGWASFHTVHWSAVDPGFIVHPSSFILSCFPNPFNPTTTISFSLPKAGYIDLNVYDVTGRLVRCLAGGHIGPPLQVGTHDIAFEGSDLPSGIYFVLMEAGEFAQTRKMVLLK